MSTQCFWAPGRVNLIGEHTDRSRELRRAWTFDASSGARALVRGDT